MPALGVGQAYGRYDPKELGAPLLSSAADPPQVLVHIF